MNGLGTALLVAGLLLAAELPAPALLLRARHQPAERIAELQNRAFPGSIPEESPLRLSLFSALYRDPTDAPDVFWSAPDRGPNDELDMEGTLRRIFLLPGYSPAIFKLQVDRERGAVRLLDAVYLKTAAGEPVSGLPNRPGLDEAPYDAAGRPLAFNANGLDPEALLRAPDLSFWMAEDYGPSLIHVARDGSVLGRHVPRGSGIRSPGYTTAETLPGILARRRPNRGFESLAAPRDGRRLYALVESPLANPDLATGLRSRLARLLEVDPASGAPVAERVVAMAKGADFGSTQDQVKFAEAAYVNRTTLLAVERTDQVARLVLIDLARASDILGTVWDDPAQLPSLESLEPEALAARGIVPCGKRVLLELNAAVPDLPQKIEGLTILDERTVAFGNDNEFAARAGAASSEIFYLRLPEPLSLETRP